MKGRGLRVERWIGGGEYRGCGLWGGRREALVMGFKCYDCRIG